MNKNEEFEVTIDGTGNDGEGIAHIEDIPVFIKDALPGDVARIGITKVKKDYCFARLIEVITPSPERTEPRCRVAKRCGGCSLQHMAYEAQAAFKQKKVHDCLKRIGGIPEKVLEKAEEDIYQPEAKYRYRNKAQYPIGMSKDGRLIGGFYANHSHDIVECADCLLSPPEFGLILKVILDFMRENKITTYNEFTHKGLVRHCLIRKGFGSGEIMVCLVINGTTLKHADKLIEALKGIPEIKSVVLNYNLTHSNVIMGDKTETIFGQPYITDILGDLKFRISANAFYQINPEVALKIYQTVLDYAEIKESDSVWDICSGIGTITLFLAQKAQKVHGIEIIPDAVRDAIENAKLNNLKNADFITADVSEYVKTHNDMQADVVVVDPPRKGLDKVVLDTIVEINPRRVVYVSCDPATLARDLKVFLAAGYKLEKYRAFDQFVHSSHVEVTALLENKTSQRGRF